MRAFTALIVCLLFAPAIAQNQPIEGQSFVIGEISFFGYAGLPVDQYVRRCHPRSGSLVIQDIGNEAESWLKCSANDRPRRH